MLQFSYLQDVDFSKGVDQYNNSSAILPGFCEDILNMDVSGTSLEKRSGFEKFAGDVPIPLEAITVTTGTATLTFPAYVNLDELSTTSPLWIYGRMTTDGGTTFVNIDFHADSFTKLSTYTLVTAGTPLSLNLTTDLGLTSHESIIQTVLASTGEVIYVTDFTVDPTDNSTSVTYNVSADVDVQFVTHTCTEVYASDDYAGSPLSMDSLETVTAATHGLSNQLIPMFWQMDSATSYTIVWPDSFVIKPNGDLSISFVPESSGKVYKLFLTACDYYVEDTAAPGTTETSKIIAGAETPYLVAACYTEDLSTGDYTLVLPESITYDSAQNQHTVTFKHSIAGDLSNYKIVYAYGNVAANRCVITGLTDTGGSTVSTGGYTYTQTSLAVTGLDNESMTTKPYVNYIDKYETNDELVIASGGQLFRSFDPDISEFCDTRVRLAADTVVGPSFTTSNYGRTGGSIVTADATGAGLLQVESILWQSGNTFRVRISATAYSAQNLTGGASSLSSIITTNSVLTLSGSMKSVLNGDFPVVATGTVDADHFYVDITVTGHQQARSNDAESGALAGIFSDSLNFQTDALFAADDVITLSSTVDCEVTTVDSIVTTRAYVKSVEGMVTLFAGQRLGATASKGSVVVPGITSELVAGDIVTVGAVVTRVSSVTVGVSSTEIAFRDDVLISNGQLTIVCPYRWQLILMTDKFLGTSPVSSTELLRSVAGRSSLYISSGVKYDGDKVYASGLPNLQMHMALTINESEGSSILVENKIVAYTGVSGNTITVSAGSETSFAIGDKVLVRTTIGGVTTCDQTAVFNIVGRNTSAGTYELDAPPTAPGGGTTCEIASFSVYRYFMRLSLLDRNGNLVVSASSGYQDLQVRLSKSAAVLLSGTVYPDDVDPVDYSNLTVEIFRRREHRRDEARTDDEVNISNYYRLVSIPLTGESGYFQFVDAVSDGVAEQSSNLDKIPDPVLGGIGEARSRLPRSASFVTAINNQLVVGDYLGDSKVDLRITGTAAYSALQTEEFNVEVLNNSGTGTTYDYYVCEETSTDKQVISAVTGIAGTSFTISVPNAEDLSAGDWILITRKVDTGLNYRPTFIGWWQIASKTTSGSPDTITVNWSKAIATASLTAADTGFLVLYSKTGKIPLVGNLFYAPISGSAESDTTIGAGLSLHLAQAINATLSSYGIRAFGGKDRFENTITVAGDKLIDVTAPITVTGTSVYIDGRTTTTGVGAAVATRYGSRIALSTKGYPEVFDSTEESVVNDLPLAQDVNPDDGERVRMAVPFFAASAFGAAQQSNVLTIFKDHSAYILDPQSKYVGSSDVFKQIDTSGYGCECPLSVVNSQVGVFFVNTTGVYLINRQFQLNRIGSAITGYIGDIFTPDSATSAVNDIVGEKLIFTSGSSSVVLHLPDSETGTVAWTRYEGIPALMWAHMDNSAVFATADGYVGKLGERFADAGESIETAVIFRYIDGGMPTVKKVLRHLSVILASESTFEKGDITAEMATDFSNVYAAMDNMKLTGSVDTILDGLSDLTRPSLQVTAFSPATVKAGWYQLKLTTDKLDAGLTIARIVYQIAMIRTRADVQAAET